MASSHDVVPRRATIAVIGLGSIGGAVAGSLGAAGRHELLACTRRPLEHLTVERPDDTLRIAIRALTDPAGARPVDWVLLCTKAHQTPATAPWLAGLCGPRTRVAVLQNGIRHAERLAPFVGGATVVPVIVYFNGERLGPDHVRMRHAGERDLAARDDADGRDFVELFAGTPMRMLLSRDFDTLVWHKLIINSAANPVTALTLQRLAVLRRADIKALCLEISEEAVAAGRADGASLSADEAARTLATVLTYPPEAGTSMYFDRLAGRPLEIEALTGAIVAAGERHSVPTPLNRLLLTLLRAVSDAAGEHPAEPGK
jgi:2-dehydropantoate 2-reductase